MAARSLYLSSMKTFALLVCLTWSSAVLGQALPEVATIDEPPGLPLWELGVGAAGLSTPAYPGADARTNRVLPVPWVQYRGRIFRADQSGIGARLFNSDRIELDVGFAGSLPARSSDVAIRTGMPNLGTLVEFGPRLKVKVAQVSPTSAIRFELPVRAVLEVRGGVRRQGSTVEPRLSYETRTLDAAWTGELQAAALFGDSRINRYFYEVRPEYATAARPAYAADAGRMLVRLGVFATHRLNPDVRLFGFARYDSYAGAANSNSPLMRQDHGLSAGLGFAWTFKRSAARAE
jgi:outer membrane scaffolding protein for murein synthesis (MipA/OmpV family)